MARREVKLRLKPGVVFQALDADEGAVLNVESRGFFILNRTGMWVTEQLAKGATREAIVSAMCRTYRKPRRACVRDLNKFLAELRAAHLLAG